MKKGAVLLLTLGAIITLIGALAFILPYPYTDSANSGPSNAWEIILVISYEGKGWYLCIGLLFMALSLIKLKSVRN